VLWKVRRWGVEAVYGRGAIPLRDMQVMETLGAVWDTLKRLHSLKGDEIHRLTDGEREVLAWLRDEGMFD